MNTIIWKGVPSTSIPGLLICELPPITKPKMKVKETTIDGMDGSIIEELGYQPYDKDVEIALRGDFDIDRIIKYFTGEGEIVFGNEPEKVYRARITDKIDYKSLLRFRKATIPFRVQPYKYKHNEAYKEAQTATTTGTSIVLTDSAKDNINSLSIYGKSWQNGTPTPTAPSAIHPLCDGGAITVTANDTNVEFVVGENGLHGIPVTVKNIATYTDANGQMWCADEIDLVRGVRVQRVGKVVPSMCSGYKELGNYARINFTIYNQSIQTPNGLCNIAKMVGDYVMDVIHFYVQNSQVWSFVPISELASRDANGAFAWLTEKGAEYYYILRNPIETALSEEEIEAFKAVLAGSHNTTVTNDEDAFMKAEEFNPFEVFNEGLEDSKPTMVLHGSGTVGISVNGVPVFEYTFPEGETEVVIDSEKEDAYLGGVLKNRHMDGEFPILMAGTNIIECSGHVKSIEILPRSRWL